MALNERLFAGLPIETKEKWETFVSGSLADMNKQNTVELVSLNLVLR